MNGHTASRDGIPGLLSRPPNGNREFVIPWAHLLVDPVRQLDSLADLFTMGLISDAEYERYKAHVRDL